MLINYGNLRHIGITGIFYSSVSSTKRQMKHMFGRKKEKTYSSLKYDGRNRRGENLLTETVRQEKGVQTAGREEHIRSAFGFSEKLAKAPEKVIFHPQLLTPTDSSSCWMLLIFFAHVQLIYGSELL